MSKRIIALLLCVLLIVPLFTACGKSENPDDKGPYITMYLSDDIYDLDPVNAYYNANTAKVASMLFDTLFTLDSNGKLDPALAKKYTTGYDEETNEYFMEIYLKEAYWSNGTRVNADDVVFAWKRLLKCDASYAAASLLYDIKNARLIKEGGKTNVYIDELGVEVVDTDHLIITFEGRPDYDQFLLNLTSIATAPLLESAVSKNADWAKKGSTIVTSGPYKLGKVVFEEDSEVEYDMNGTDGKGAPLTKEEMSYTQKISYFYLERNAYYNRDTEKDDIDEAVTNYRLLVDCTKTDAELLEDYKDGKLFYMGDIPLSIREDEFVKANVQVSDALSTIVCYLNENALIDDGSAEGSALFADANVRKALSLVIDREAIAKKLVYAKAASALVPAGIFDTDKNSDFRTNGGHILNTTATPIESAKVQQFLAAAGIGYGDGQIPADSFTFTIKVASYNEVHLTVANMLAEFWGSDGLGFNVSVEEVNPIVNNDYFKEQNQIPTDLCDDLFTEDLAQGDYEVAILDSVAYSATAYSMLSSFAPSFSGAAANVNNFNENTTNVTGYSSVAYDLLMEAIYCVPYFAALTENDWNFTGRFESVEEYRAFYAAVKQVYADNGITPSQNPDDWAAQRAKLLHKAEKLLLTDLPVIPIVFNQNAQLVSDQITDVSSNYYSPAIFTKSDVKDYERFCYTENVKNNKGKNVLDADGNPVIEYKTIFDNFPEIDWKRLEEGADSTDDKSTDKK